MRSDEAFIKREFAKYVDLEFGPSKAMGNRDVAQYRQRTQGMATHGVVVTAYIVQANDNLYQRGAGSNYPCLALITFDPAHANDRPFMQAIAEKLSTIKGTRQMDPDLAKASQLVTDEAAVRDRRRLVPASLTKGVDVYAVDLWLYRPRLATGYLTEGEILCLADAGPIGGIEQLPYWIPMGMTADAVKPEPLPFEGLSKASRSSLFSGISGLGLVPRVTIVVLGIMVLAWRVSNSVPSISKAANDVSTTPTRPSAQPVRQPGYYPSSTPIPRMPGQSPMNINPGSHNPYVTGARMPGYPNRPGQVGWRPGMPPGDPRFGPGNPIPPDPYGQVNPQPGMAPPPSQPMNAEPPGPGPGYPQQAGGPVDNGAPPPNPNALGPGYPPPSDNSQPAPADASGQDNNSPGVPANQPPADQGSAYPPQGSDNQQPQQ